MFVPLYRSGWCTSGPSPSPTAAHGAQPAQKWDNTRAQMPNKSVRHPSTSLCHPKLPLLLVCVGTATLQDMFCRHTRTHTQKLSWRSVPIHTLSIHSGLCVYGGILREWTRGRRHVKTKASRLSLGVSSIFSIFAFIFGPFAFLCDCLYLYLVILWIIPVFFASMFSHFASPCAFVVVLCLTMAGLREFIDASRWGLLQVFTRQFFHFCVTLHLDCVYF